MSRPSRRGRNLPLPTAEAGTDNGADGIDWTTGGTAGGEGVSTLSATGDPELTGDVTLSAGTNVTLTQVGQDIEISAASAGSTIITQDEGGTLSSAVTTLDFVGAGVTASGAGATTTITIPGGGGGGGGPNGRIIDWQTYGRFSGGTTNTLPSTPATGDVILFIVGLEGVGRTASVSGAGATWTKQATPSDNTGASCQAEIFTGVVGGSPTTSITYSTTSGTTVSFAAIIRGPAGTLDAGPQSFLSTSTTGGGGEKRSPFITPASTSIAIAAGFARSGTANPLYGDWFNMLPNTFAPDSDCLYFAWNPQPPASMFIAMRAPASGTAIGIFSIT